MDVTTQFHHFYEQKNNKCTIAFIKNISKLNCLTTCKFFPIQYVMQYPFVMKQIRDMILKPKARSHCCQTLLMKEGTGYRDLDELANNPQELEFTFGRYKILKFS